MPRAHDLVRGLFFPWSLGWTLRDRLDERRARRLREAHGLRGCLLSWQPGNAGGWRSRISCPGLVYTIERVGKTRVEAIRRAVRARARILTLRDVIRLDRMPTPPHDNP